jgi:hypothetical protein
MIKREERNQNAEIPTGLVRIKKPDEGDGCCT